MKLVECVPNFSEGRDKTIIEKIANTIKEVEGVKLLDIDSGAATNRSVVTFVGEPDQVVEAAFRAIKKASELIDMSKHKGAHARQGATDVCPFVPISEITMDECVELANCLAKRVGEELHIPIYLYEYAAKKPERKNLADIREGEYEALPEKLKKPEWKPDYGPQKFNQKSGATVIGARKILIAYNINLNTKNTKLAKSIANIIREKGIIKKDEKGNKCVDSHGSYIREPGLFKCCKATGWYIEEYNCSQITMNLTDWEVTPIHKVFDTVSKLSEEKGLRVTGSEIVGMIPKAAMLEAGRYFLQKQGSCTGVPEEELIEIAIKSLGLTEVAEFDPKHKIIENVFYNEKELKQMRVCCFVNEVSINTPAPGGGSVAALAGALGSALSSMVSSLTFDKKGFESKKPLLDETAVNAQHLKQFFIEAIDKDTQAFNKVMEAFKLPKNTEEEKLIRENQIEEANKGATLVPLSVLQNCLDAIKLSETVIKEGNPNSLSDSGVSATMIYGAAQGAYYNVLINLQGVKDSTFISGIKQKAAALYLEIEKRALQCKDQVLNKLT